MELSYGTLTSTLLKEFPNLRDRAEMHHASDLAYPLFGDIFSRYILLVTHDEEARSRVADFINRMADSSDGQISELLRVEVLPSVLESQQVLDAYWPHLGDRARKLLSLCAVRMKPEIVVPKIPGMWRV